MTNTTVPVQPLTVNINGFSAEVYKVGDEFYPLTLCCNATATGTEDGAACRACYRLIDPEFGMTFTAADLI